MSMRRNPIGYYALRRQILERDNFTCQYCGQHAPNVPLEVDHKIEVSNGGTDDPENLITSCWACNRGKEHLRGLQRKRKEGNKKGRDSTSPRSNKILRAIATSNGITTKELKQKLNILRSNADVRLWQLRQKQLIIKRDGKWYSNKVYEDIGETS